MRDEQSVGTIETVRSVLLSKLGARNGPTLIAMWYQRRKVKSIGHDEADVRPPMNE
jgi:hypothetical protein